MRKRVLGLAAAAAVAVATLVGCGPTPADSPFRTCPHGQILVRNGFGWKCVRIWP